MGFDSVTSPASAVTDEEAEQILAAFREAAGDDEADEEAQDLAATEPDDEGDEDGVSVTSLDPTGDQEADEPEEAKEDKADASVVAADAARVKREALQQQIQALFDDPAADVEAGLASLLHGEPPPAGRRWRLVRRGSVTAGQVKALKGETISGQEYQMLTGRVKAFFDVVELVE